jgi:hypothetical protein
LGSLPAGPDRGGQRSCQSRAAGASRRSPAIRPERASTAHEALPRSLAVHPPDDLMANLAQ